MSDEIILDGVFERIKEVYSLQSDAAMARHLGIYPQDVPRMKKSGNLPYKQILNTCDPDHWEYLFLGRRSAHAVRLEDAIKYVLDAGYRVEKAP